MAKERLKKIPVGETSESSHISPRKRYRVQIEGKWYEGNFTKQWFGWNFENYGNSGIQLNMIDQVFEICPPALKKEPPKPRPTSEGTPGI